MIGNTVDAGRQLSSALEAHKSGTRSEIMGGVSGHSRNFATVVAHENDHFRRLLGTPYGFLEERLWQQMLSALFELVAIGARAGRMLTFPLVDETLAAAAIAGVDSSERTRAARRAVGAQSLLLALRRDVDSELFGPARRTFEELFIDPVGAPVEYAAPVPQPGYSGAGQVFGVGGQLVALGAVHVLEHFALGAQGNLGLGMGMGMERLEELLQDPSRDYSYLPLLAGATWDLGKFPSPGGQKRAEDELLIEYFRLYPFELHAAADLALWVPLVAFQDLSPHVFRSIPPLVPVGVAV